MKLSKISHAIRSSLLVTAPVASVCVNAADIDVSLKAQVVNDLVVQAKSFSDPINEKPYLKSLLSGKTQRYLRSNALPFLPSQCRPILPIAVNSSVTDSLTSAACYDYESDSYNHVYSFAVKAGSTYSIAVNSPAFDAYVDLYDTKDNWLARDDDGGVGNDAKLVYTAVASETLYIVVTSYEAEAIGAYTVTLNSKDLDSKNLHNHVAVPKCSASPIAISVGSTVNGSLTTEDCQLSDGSYYDPYSFTVTAGTTYTITLNSSAFDAFVYLVNLNIPSVISSDNNSGGGTNAKIVYTATTSGTLHILANSFSGGEVGAYSLSVVIGGSANSCLNATPISVGSITSGSLTTTDCRFSDGSYYDKYSFTTTAGTTYLITLNTMNAVLFDAFVWLLDSNDNVIAVNNNGNGGKNSRIEYTATTSGTMHIVANSAFADMTGAYSLTLINKNAGNCQPSPIAIAVGSTKNGTLTATDCRVVNTSFYDYYSFSATAGTTYSITLNSTAFDAYLYLKNSAGVITYNNNGNGGTNAKIVYKATTSGTLYIMATSLYMGEGGAYTLNLTTGGTVQTCPPLATSIAVGNTKSGTLTDSDCTLTDGTYYDHYAFAATAGTTYSITLNSTAFDAFLYLLNDYAISLDVSDNTNGGTNSKIVYIPTITEQLHIIVNTMSAGELGSYTLTLNTGGSALPDVITLLPSNFTATSMTLNARVDANAATTTASFDFGTTTSYGTNVTASPSTITGTSDVTVTANKTGLTCNTEYHYRIKATNSNGTAYGTNVRNITSACPPTATTNAASNITATSARLNGVASANGSSTSVNFDFGTNTNYTTTVAATPSVVTNNNTTITANKTGLTCNTTYYYRLKAMSGAGTTYGASKSFKTAACGATATTNAATNITKNSATLNGQVNGNGITTTVSFNLGTTTSYGTTITANPSSVTGNTAVSANKTGLICNTTYHYRVKAAVSPTIATYGADKTFRTLSCF